MDDLPFYVHCNSISVISGGWVGDNERMCTTEPRLQMKRSLSQAELEDGTARSAGQRLTLRATGAPHCIQYVYIVY